MVSSILEIAGKFDPRDAADKVKFQKILEDLKAPRKTSGIYIPTTKRMRSKDKMLTASVKRSKFADIASTSSSNVVVLKLMSEVEPEYLKVAMVDSLAPRRRMAMDLWMQDEAKLTLMTMLSKPLSRFDSSEMIRGYRVFK